MKARLIVAEIGIPFLLFVLIVLPGWATMVLVALISALGAYELLHAAGMNQVKWTVWLAMAFSAVTPVWFYFDGGLRIFTGGLFALVLALFCTAVFRFGKEPAFPFTNIAAIIFAAGVIPSMLSCLLLLRLAPNGRCMVFAPLAAAFGSDTLAFFSGRRFGKHKLAPRVSPNKTVEGALGGLLGGAVGMLVVGLVAHFGCHLNVNIGIYVLFGLLGSVAAQIGDLSFSVIKREYGIKDYGKILPGHGGVLDRFDSVIFVSPLMWLLLL